MLIFRCKLEVNDGESEIKCQATRWGYFYHQHIFMFVSVRFTVLNYIILYTKAFTVCTGIQGLACMVGIDGAIVMN